MKTKKPIWWPENPYPEDIFPMQVGEYVALVPDEGQRTALSGCLGRMFWRMASDAILEAWSANKESTADEKLKEIIRTLYRRGDLPPHSVMTREEIDYVEAACDIANDDRMVK